MISRLFQTAFNSESVEPSPQASVWLWSVGAPLVVFPTLTFILTTLWFAAGASLSALAAGFILSISAAAALYLPRVFLPSVPRLAPLVALLLAALAILLSGLVYDTSLDGQQYHFQAIYALSEGWNPLRGETTPPVIGDPFTLWAAHYPRGGTIFSANLLAAGLPLAAAKPLNFLLLFGTSALLGGMLLRCGFSHLFAALLTAAAVMSPVVVGQLFTTMNDGLLGLLILVFAVSAVAWIRDQDRLAAITGLAAIILALNLKFSAIPIFVILCAFASGSAWFVRGQGAGLRVGAALLTTAVVAIGLIGWSPYMQNLLDHGHVFHPLMGTQAVDIMQQSASSGFSNTPAALRDMSPVERFFFSLFSETHAGFETEPHLKVPFTVSVSEIRTVGGVDVRLGGFGPFFSGAILLAAVCTVMIWFRSPKQNNVTLGLLLIAFAMLVSVALMPENWWARYVPQFWFVPLAIAAAAISAGRLPAQVLGTVIVGILFFNGTLAGAVGVRLNANRSAEAAAQIEAMRAANLSYCLFPETAEARIYLMREAGVDIRYTPRTEIACPAPEQIAGYGPDRFGGQICVCTD